MVKVIDNTLDTVEVTTLIQGVVLSEHVLFFLDPNDVEFVIE